MSKKQKKIEAECSCWNRLVVAEKKNIFCLITYINFVLQLNFSLSIFKLSKATQISNTDLFYL